MHFRSLNKNVWPIKNNSDKTHKMFKFFFCYYNGRSFYYWKKLNVKIITDTLIYVYTIFYTCTC